MPDKLELRREALAAANHLALTVQRLGRAKPAQQDALLRAADKDLATYRRCKRAISYKGAVVPIIEPVDMEVEDVMNALHEVIRDKVEPLGFALFVISGDADASICYTTNVLEEDLGAVMQQFADAFDAGARG